MTLEPNAPPASPSILRLRWFWVAFAAALLARVLFVALGGYELLPDEAVHWQYSRRLDWCYYTKGPLTAWSIWLGTLAFGHRELGVRLGAIAYSMATLLFSCLLYERMRPGERRGVAGLLILHQTVPLSVAGSLIINADSGLIAAWAICAWALHGATHGGGRRMWAWLAAGLALGILSKMAMFFFFPAMFLYLGLSPENRRFLRSPWPWLASAGGLVALAPQIAWDARHGWIMLRHQAQHGSVGSFDWHRFLVGFPEFVGAQIGVLSPVLAVLIGVAAVHQLRRLKSDDSLFVSCLAAPTFLFFAGLSFFRVVNANWPATMHLGLFLGAALYWAPRWAQRRARRWIAGGFGVGAAISLMLLWPAPAFQLAKAVGADPGLLPQSRSMGWRDMARAAHREAQSLPGPHFYIGRTPGEASLLAFYLPGQPWTFAQPHRTVSNQYGIWGGWDEVAGQDAVFATHLRKERHAEMPPRVREGFAEVGEGVVSEHRLAGMAIKRYKIWVCMDFGGWEAPEWPGGARGTLRTEDGE